MISDERIRWDAIAHVLALREKWWAAVPASELRTFVSGADEIFLKGQQGIFKPRQMDLPLSIVSTLSSPYTDTLIGGHKIYYDFAPWSREYENDRLKRCAERRLPLIYLLQLKPKPQPEYQIFAPVTVEGWDESSRVFTIDLSPNLEEYLVPQDLLSSEGRDVQQVREIVKGYTVTPVARRLHQAKFREQVLRAYRERCAVCVLRVRPLLDAAHIVPDRDPTPTIVVNEGLSLCATHHRAFDARILRYDDSYRVRVELPSGTRVGDGERTMLLDFNGKPLSLPSDQALWPVPAL